MNDHAARLSAVELKVERSTVVSSETDRRVDALEETIHGNGHEGLKSKVLKHEQILAEMPEYVRRLSRVERGFYIAIGLGIAAEAVIKFLMH